MKFLISILLILINFGAFAGPGDGPVVPWPTSIDRENIDLDDLQGEWVAFEHNSVWHIEIQQPEDGSDYSTILITSAALFTHKATGWFVPADRIFYGQLVMDEKHETSFVIFKDRDGTKLRLKLGPDRFLDLKLFRTK